MAHENWTHPHNDGFHRNTLAAIENQRIAPSTPLRYDDWIIRSPMIYPIESSSYYGKPTSSFSENQTRGDASLPEIENKHIPCTKHHVKYVHEVVPCVRKVTKYQDVPKFKTVQRIRQIPILEVKYDTKYEKEERNVVVPFVRQKVKTVEKIVEVETPPEVKHIPIPKIYDIPRNHVQPEGMIQKKIIELERVIDKPVPLEMIHPLQKIQKNYVTNQVLIPIKKVIYKKRTIEVPVECEKVVNKFVEEYVERKVEVIKIVQEAPPKRVVKIPRPVMTPRPVIRTKERKEYFVQEVPKHIERHVPTVIHKKKQFQIEQPHYEEKEVQVRVPVRQFEMRTVLHRREIEMPPMEYTVVAETAENQLMPLADSTLAPSISSRADLADCNEFDSPIEGKAKDTLPPRPPCSDAVMLTAP